MLWIGQPDCNCIVCLLLIVEVRRFPTKFQVNLDGFLTSMPLQVLVTHVRQGNLSPWHLARQVHAQFLTQLLRTMLVNLTLLRVTTTVFPHPFVVHLGFETPTDLLQTLAQALEPPDLCSPVN